VPEWKKVSEGDLFGIQEVRLSYFVPAKPFVERKIGRGGGKKNLQTGGRLDRSKEDPARKGPLLGRLNGEAGKRGSFSGGI